MRTRKTCKCCGQNGDHDPNDTVCRYCNWRMRRGLVLHTRYPVRSIYEMTQHAPGFAAFCAPRLVIEGKRYALSKKAKHGAAYRAAFAAYCKPRGMHAVLKDGPYTTGRVWSPPHTETAMLVRHPEGFDSRLHEAPKGSVVFRRKERLVFGDQEHGRARTTDPMVGHFGKAGEEAA
jgi:hypothetical protein